MLNPIDVYDPHDVSYSAAGSLALLSETVGQSGQSYSVAGGHYIPARQSLGVGNPLDNWAYTTLGVGVSGTVSSLISQAALGLFEVDGPTIRAASRSLAVSRSTLASSEMSRLMFEIASSRAIVSSAPLGIVINGKTLSVARMSQIINQRYNRIMAQSADVGGRSSWPSRMSATFGALQSSIARLALETRTMDDFLILADIYPVALSSPAPDANGIYPTQVIEARLYIDGVPVDIESFEYNEPRGRLGATLNLVMADKNLGPVPFNGEVLFQIAMYDGTQWATYTLVEGGRIGGRDYTISLRSGNNYDGPADTLSISSTDIIADKFTLCPPRPVIMYDPSKVREQEVKVDRANLVMDEVGQPIEPSIEPVQDLTMYQAVQRAIGNQRASQFINVNQLRSGTSSGSGSSIGIREIDADFLAQADAVGFGMGFQKFITNIKNYPISRADFNWGGYFDAIQPLIGMYPTSYFTLGQTLYILDREAKLPFGYLPKLITVDDYSYLGLSIPFKEPLNAVLLTYTRQIGPGEGVSYTYRYEQTTEEPGSAYGTLGYQRIETTAKIRQTRLDSDPSSVVAEIAEEVKTSTFGHFPAIDGGPGALIEVHRETQQDRYNGELKVGHTKEVMGLITSGPDASLQLVQVQKETCEIAWKDDPSDIGRQIQARNHTRIEGLIYTATYSVRRVNPLTGAVVDVPARYPALVAQASGIIEDDGAMGFGPIKTITETLRATGSASSQVDVQTVVVDLITGTVQRSITQPRTGSRSASEFGAKQTTKLLKDDDLIALIGFRTPFGINTAELPEDRALELGHRVLYRLGHPLSEKRLNLPFVDLTLQRGTVVTAQMRLGQTGNYLVEGRSLSGESLGQPGAHKFTMALEAAELPT